ncbi:peptidoglycan editing factor PgeF [bacterium]|nr:MAG: peptidoglycan editing factor PgeF [bacterium]
MLFAMDLLCLKVSHWGKQDGLLHGFLGRRGGKSQGPYASLNISFGVGDDPEVVKDNMCDVKRAVGVHDLRIVTMKQVHGDRILEVKDKNLKVAGEADGMVTEKREIFLGVLTADCASILFTVPERKLAGAVHAGWRGTLAGIAPKMVQHLEERYGVKPSSIEVALGPSIGPCCYEVGADVSCPMVEKWERLAEENIHTRDGKTFLNLREVNRSQLEEAGVPAQQIHQVGPCTSCAPEDFFSYRRAKGKTGHQMSFIGWLE